MIKRYFAFIPGLRDPEGQIFHDLPTKQQYLFGPVEVGDETLDELILKFKSEVGNV